MITARLGFEAAAAGRSGTAIGSHPIAELRVRAHKSAAHIGADPVVIDYVRPDMRIAHDEVFGPVLAIIRTNDVDEAIAVENASPYGNAASIFKAGRCACW